MSSHLLDANVLIALIVREHEHHAHATAWVTNADRVMLCSVVEGALVRALVRLGEPAATAVEVLKALYGANGFEFLRDDLSYVDVPVQDILGHRQVTDAYLVELAKRAEATLATFDKDLASAHEDAVLIPTR